MSRPSISIVPPRELHPRAWGREIIVAETPSYLGKVLRMARGTAGNLQYHVQKDETFLLIAGEAIVDYDAGDGTLTRMPLSPSMAVHVPPGAPHRVIAVTDCVFVEFSTPHFDDRVRCEREYGEPEVDGLPSTHDPHADATGQP